jgi:hypothetical protein
VWLLVLQTKNNNYLLLENLCFFVYNMLISKLCQVFWRVNFK